MVITLQGSRVRTAQCGVCRRDRIRSRYLNSLFPSDQLSFSSFLPPPTSPTINGDHEAPENVRLYCLTGSWLYVDVVAASGLLWLWPWSPSVLSQSSLEDNIPGLPGADYPTLSSPPDTSFSCADKVSGGYYADTEAGCQGKSQPHLTACFIAGSIIRVPRDT